MKKHNINYWAGIASSFVLFFMFLVLYTDAKIILKNNYEETNNKLYLILLFVVLVLRWSYFRF
jgi:uncharacterized membrane protein YozB (DUF420 family)